jgi:hypothetical protein
VPGGGTTKHRTFKFECLFVNERSQHITVYAEIKINRVGTQAMFSRWNLVLTSFI